MRIQGTKNYENTRNQGTIRLQWNSGNVIIQGTKKLWEFKDPRKKSFQRIKNFEKKN